MIKNYKKGMFKQSQRICTLWSLFICLFTTNAMDNNPNTSQECSNEILATHKVDQDICAGTDSSAACLTKYKFSLITLDLLDEEIEFLFDELYHIGYTYTYESTQKTNELAALYQADFEKFYTEGNIYDDNLDVGYNIFSVIDSIPPQYKLKDGERQFYKKLKDIYKKARAINCVCFDYARFGYPIMVQRVRTRLKEALHGLLKTL